MVRTEWLVVRVASLVITSLGVKASEPFCNRLFKSKIVSLWSKTYNIEEDSESLKGSQSLGRQAYACNCCVVLGQSEASKLEAWKILNPYFFSIQRRSLQVANSRLL